ncbi:MAG: cobalamin B12-binding domain-containing protein [Rhodospirillaceae bacterium]|nr:cobalamin B12-binding domain-containing protein [Rhodospirillaceae bacterium]
MRVLLVVYDNASYTHIFPMGMGYVASVLEKSGHDVDVYSQDQHHYPDEHLTQYLNENKYDVIGVSLIAGYYQYQKLLGISKAIDRSKNRPIYIIGGYGPTPEPEFFLHKTGADIIVMGEGEETTVELMTALADKTPLDSVAGIAFRNGKEVTINPRRPLIEDLDSIPWPAYHKFPIEYYRMVREVNAGPLDFTIPMMSARGCTFKCTFCYRMDTGYRARNPKDLLDEVEFLNKEYGITYVSFQDDLLMSSVSHTEDVCREFVRRNLGVKWNCNGRLNYCSLDLLKMMKQAGCVFINYGIESMDNEVLKKMKKGLREEQIVKGIEETLEVGISPGLNMMFGNIGDTRETLKKAVDFLVKYDDFAQMRTIRPVTPYPGSPLYFDAIGKGMIKDVEDFYENKHLNSDLLAANFTEMSDDEVYECLAEANTTLLENYHNAAKQGALAQVKTLYGGKDANFRGFRQI